MTPRKISKTKLISLYNKFQNAEVCIKMGITEPTLMKLLRKAGIELKGKGNRSDRFKYVVV